MASLDELVMPDSRPRYEDIGDGIIIDHTKDYKYYLDYADKKLQEFEDKYYKKDE